MNKATVEVNIIHKVYKICHNDSMTVTNLYEISIQKLQFYKYQNMHLGQIQGVSKRALQ
jgi:hypothetical protein